MCVPEQGLAVDLLGAARRCDSAHNLTSAPQPQDWGRTHIPEAAGGSAWPE